MNPRNIIFVGALFVAGAAVPAVRLFAITGPAARDTGDTIVSLQKRNAEIGAHLAAVPAHDQAATQTELESARDAELWARSLAELLQNRDGDPADTSPEEREKFSAEYAARTGKSINSVAALFPKADVPEPEAIFQFITVRYLLIAAEEAPRIEFNYVAFPSPSASAIAKNNAQVSRYGVYFSTRKIRLEYVTDYARHQNFAAGLLRRRERGPFYSLDAVSVRPAAQPRNASLTNASQVLVTLDLCRILGKPQ
ncbi:MAG: hypothetical protein ACKVS6_13280 [Planctomycetota bacterium]